MRLTPRIKQAGLGLGVAGIFIVGYLSTAGQYVPSDRDTLARLSSTCSAGGRPEWSGTAWTCRRFNDYAGTHLEWSYDFTSNIQSVFTLATASGGQTGNPGGSHASTRPGTTLLGTGNTNASGRASLYAEANAFSTSSGQLAATWVGSLSQFSTATDEFSVVFGFGDVVTSPNQTDGCGFAYDRGNVLTNGANPGNVNRWQCWCADTNVRTFYLLDGTTVSDGGFITGSVAAASGWHRFDVTMTATLARFYYDGAEVCRISTNIPTGSEAFGALVGVFGSAGTNHRWVGNDYFGITVDLLAARSP